MNYAKRILRPGRQETQNKDRKAPTTRAQDTTPTTKRSAQDAHSQSTATQRPPTESDKTHTARPISR